MTQPNQYRLGRHGPLPLQEIAQHELGCRHHGAVENARETARNNSEAIGRLLDVLRRKGVLGILEIREVLALHDALGVYDDPGASAEAGLQP